jgi:hypothetical protein
MKEIVANRIKAIKEYLKYFPDDRTANNNLILYEYSNLLDIDLDTNHSYYPMVEYGYLRVNRQIKLGREYQLANSHTGYHQNKKEILVIWSEPCGRLAFVDNRYYCVIENEWDEFMNILKSYEPLDYDPINNTYIYDIEHGKKLIVDYKDIVGNFEEKLRSKVNEILIQDKREQLKQLQEELKVLNNA